LFCWVFLWTVAWWTKSSLRFAFSSCRMNFPETQFQSWEKKMQKINQIG
jgi:hypothetical protein